MPAPLRDKNEIKIFILFLMDKIGYPLDFDTVSAIVVQDGVVRFFDFADSFYELLDAGHICAVEEDGSSAAEGENGVKEEGKLLYTVTDTGREVAQILGENLMITVREQGERSAARHLSLSRLGAAIDQRYETLEKGFLYHCDIRDGRGEILTVSLRVDNRRQLERIQRNFADRPEIIYRGILALLSGDVNYIFE